MIIQTQYKNSTVNQTQRFLVTRLRLQGTSNVCPGVTVLSSQSRNWELRGRGGVFYNVLQILVNGSGWHYIA